MEFIFIRHPESTYNAAGNRYCGRTDAPLSDIGLEQVQALQDYFADVPVSAVWSSPLLRARTLAEAIATQKGLTVNIDEAFTEFDFGDWEGVRADEIRARDPQLWSQWNTGHPFAAPPSGERPIDVYSRVVTGMQQLTAGAAKDGRIVIVSHDQVIRMLFTFFLSLPYSQFRQLGQPRNASLCRVRADIAKGTWRMLSYSETVK